MGGKLRVLVVEDSLTVRRRICDVLATDPQIEIVGEAGDGSLGVELCRELRPDVITLDMHLPDMDGLAATEHIMAYTPTPILIVSSSTNRGDMFKTYDALAAGAVDALEKPNGSDTDSDWEPRLVSTVKRVSRIKVITHPRARLRDSRRSSVIPTLQPAVRGEPGAQRVVAIGASTGGPSALVSVLSALPHSFRLPVLIVIHIGELFAPLFAEWLAKQVRHPVAYARGGEMLESLGGKILMAPATHHMAVHGSTIELTSSPPRHSCRPSIDVLFDSLAMHCGANTLACLLTGMGSDGASGLLKIRNAGGQTIVQDEATCVVYGMPREAVMLGAAQRVLPISEIGPALATAAGSLQRS